MPASFRGGAASTSRPRRRQHGLRPCSTEGARCQRPIPGAPCTVDEDCIGISGSMGEALRETSFMPGTTRPPKP